MKIVDAGLSGYFDTIPHAELLRLLARRVNHGAILKRVRLFPRGAGSARASGQVCHSRHSLPQRIRRSCSIISGAP